MLTVQSVEVTDQLKRWTNVISECDWAVTLTQWHACVCGETAHRAETTGNRPTHTCRTGWPKKWHHFSLYALTLPNINRFSKLFHSQNKEKICNQSIQSIYSVAGSKPMHSNTLGYNTIKNNEFWMKVKKGYSASVLELVKERTSNNTVAVIILLLKISPHLKCVATLPCEKSVLKATIENDDFCNNTF